MADVHHLISLGIGSPADIPHLVLVGLSPFDVVIDGDVSLIEGEGSYVPAIAARGSYAPAIAGSGSYVPSIAGRGSIE